MFKFLKDKLKSIFTEEKVEKPKKEKKKKETTIKSKSAKKEPKQVEEKTQKKGFFSKVAATFTTEKITEEQVQELFNDLELILLENNVALEAVDAMRISVSKSLVGTTLKKGEIEKSVKVALKEAIQNVLTEPEELLNIIRSSEKPYIILFFGINGTGKTTSIAKVSHYLKKNKLSSVLAAADTFRAASIEQLETHAHRLGTPIVKSTYGADPASVAFDAIQYAKKHRIDVVLIDTAGRMYTKENLMREMDKIIRISKPNLKLFVGEAIAGNDVIDQARTFNDSVGLDGIILTKADVDEKGGSILSVSHVTGKPIYFLGIGQEYGDLKEFRKKDVLATLGLE